MVLYYNLKTNKNEVKFECNHIYYFEGHLIAYKYSLIGAVETKIELKLEDLKGFEVRQI